MWTEVTSKPVGHGADCTSMSRVIFCGAYFAKIIVLAHFNPRPDICSNKDGAHSEPGHVLTSPWIYVL